MNLVYTDEAIGDLMRLRGFIAEHNPPAAGRVAAELVDKIELLADSPYLGIEVPLAPSPGTIRDMIFGRYIVRYSTHTSTVIILRVWHELEGER